MAPHSATVRGTISNPKTAEAKKTSSENRTLLGDAGSLKSETSSTEPVPDRTAQDGGSVSTPSSAPQYKSTSDKDQPHSARVRGTLSHPDTAKKMYEDEAGEKKPKAGVKAEKPGSIGDPVSLRAEHGGTEVTENDRGAGKADDTESMEAAAVKRKDNEIRNSSKL
jgi:hypothetical protein